MREHPQQDEEVSVLSGISSNSWCPLPDFLFSAGMEGATPDCGRECLEDPEEDIDRWCPDSALRLPELARFELVVVTLPALEDSSLSR
jgi:hypothetical protein